MRLKGLIVVQWNQMARLAEATHSLRWLGAVSRKFQGKRGSPHVQHPVQLCSLLCTVVGISEKCRNFASLDGLDVDEEVKQNPDLRRVYIYDGGDWPIPDESYDAVVANYVLEHLEKPQVTIAEAFRVLRPGGFFFFRTPNLFYYVCIVASLTPHWFHRLVANRLRNLPPETHDPWPTHYRMNRPRTIRRLMHSAGFKEVALNMVEKEPSYGMYSRALFFLLMSYERVVNSSKFFPPLRGNIFGAFVKPQTIAKE